MADGDGAEFRTIVERSLNGIIVYRENRVIYANPALADIFGYAIDEIVGMPVLDLLAEDERPRAVQNLRRRLTGELPPGRIEYRGQRKDGRIVDMELSISSIDWHDGPAILASIVDITERKRAARQRDEMDRLLAAMMDNSPIPLNILVDGRYVYANARSHALFARPGETLIGREAAELYQDPADREYAKSLVDREGELIGFETNLLRGDGVPIWCALHSIRTIYRGRAAYFAAVVDLSERKAAEDRVRRSEALLRAILDNAPLGFGFRDMAGHFEIVNPEGAAMLGQLEAAIIGRRIDEFTPPDFAEMLTTMDRVALAEGQGEGEGEIGDARLPERGKRRIRMVSFPVRDADGELQGMGSFALDVTAEWRALKALAKSESRFRALFDAAPVALSVFRDGMCVASNAMADEYVMGPDGSFAGDGSEAEPVPDKATTESGREVQLRRHDGSTPTCVMQTVEIPWNDGTAWLHGFVDISAQKEAEAAVRENEKLLRSIVDTAPAAFLYRDRDRRIRMANPVSCRWMGLSESELIGRSLSELYRFEGREAFLELDDQVFETGETVETIAPFPLPDGSVMRIRSIRFAVLDENGEVVGIGNIGLDLTELVEARNLMSATLAAAQLGIFRTDDAGLIESFNPAAERLFGHAAADIVGRDFTMLLSAEDGALQRELARRYLEEGDMTIVRQAREVECRRSDGSPFVVELTVGATDIEGSVKFIGALRDLTDLKRTEEQLRQAQKMDALGQLTGGVAHDFNNLLAVVSGNLELLDESSNLVDDDRQLVEPALRAARRGADLTERLLSFARSEAVKVQVFDVASQLAATLAMIERTLGGNVRVDLEAPERLFVEADSAQFDTAVLNLAVNARDAMRTGGRLRITAAPSHHRANGRGAAPQTLPAGDYARIRFIDEGAGMSEEVRARALEPFFTTKQMGQGTGLGLSMVYGFAMQSRGQIQIDSTPGEGTTVTLYLPLTKAAQAGLTAVPQPAAAKGRKARVLLVENDGDVRTVLAAAIQRLGHDVLSLDSAERALGLIKLAPDINHVVVSDNVDGRVTAADLLQWLAEHRPDVRAIVSATAPSGEAPFGGLPRLDKPFSRDDLLRLFGRAN